LPLPYWSCVGLADALLLLLLLLLLVVVVVLLGDALVALGDALLVVEGDTAEVS
jgi:hypothetical protein